MLFEGSNKASVRKGLRERLAGMGMPARREKSQLACANLVKTPEFAAARVVMLYLSLPSEVDTAAIALRCWQEGKTVVVPKVSWSQRRMMAVEISSLAAGMKTGEMGIREPLRGKPMPVDLLDLVVVPGLGFTAQGHRIGRGMGFFDRFLSQDEFMGLSCGLAFEEQVVEELPVLDHDVPLSMLVTDRGIRRFASNLIRS